MLFKALCKSFPWRKLFTTKTLLIMKLTAIILLSASLTTSAKGHSQRVTLSLQNASMETVFKEIKKQTGYDFLYGSKMLQVAKPVSIKVKNASLERVLEKCFIDQPLMYNLVNRTIIVKPKTTDPNINPGDINEPPPPIGIKGKVTNEKGEPLLGATVQVKGTNQSTVANTEGYFSLDVSSGKIVLVISFVGYITQEINVEGKIVINVMLENYNKNLSDVVITAFGLERKKKALGYTAQEIKGSALTEARETNVLNSLKGKVAGVHINSSSGGPAGSSYIAIRGNSSLAGNNQPLFVVDGIPINNDFSANVRTIDYGDGIKDINPDDIESITVLKGPNGTALYGSRGANGVILITSKKGSKKGVGISLNSNATFESPNIRKRYQNIWGPGYNNQSLVGGFDYWNRVTINGVEYMQQPGWMNQSWGPEMDGRLISIEKLPELGLVPFTAQPEGNLNGFFQTGKTYTNTVSVSGSSEKTNFRASFSNLSNKGIVPNNSFNRNTFNFLAGTHITPKLYIEAKANYIRENGKNRPINQWGLTDDFAGTLRNIDLDWLKDYKGSDYKMKSYNNSLNPYFVINEFLEDDQRDRMIGYASFRYSITNWLSLMGKTGTDFYTDVRNERKGYGVPFPFRGSMQNVQSHTSETNTDVLLTATGKLSKDFTGTISAGGNLYKLKSETTGNSGTNFIIPEFYTISNTSPATRIPLYSLVRKEIQSAYMFGQVAFKNYLFLDLTARNDWSSTLGKNNYSFFYPSASMSFVLTDAFNISSNLLSFAKIRASYAQAGADASPYLTKGGYFSIPGAFNGQLYSGIFDNLPLADLKNELKKSLEFGTEIRFFKNRLALDFTYYDASTINQIVPIQVPSSTGFSTKLINSGEVSNKGIEIFASGMPFKNPNSFSWEISVNLSTNKSKIVSLYPGINTLVLRSDYNVSIEARPGEPYGNIVGFKYKRNAEGQLLLSAPDANGLDGGLIQRSDSREILGNIQPKWLAGVTNTFSYKRFSLGVMIDVRNGGQIASATKFRESNSGVGKFSENRTNLINDGLIENADGTFTKNNIVVGGEQYYAWPAYFNIGEAFTLSASYVAIRELNFGYDFKPGRLYSKFLFTTARLSIVGRNLGYLQRDPQFKIMGTSPESSFAPTAAAQGFETRGLPTTRSIGFNLSLSF